MSYRSEFRLYWINLLGAAIGLATGITLNFFTLNIFGPRLIADLHWTKAQFALIGSLPIFMIFAMPVGGWLVDRYGSRLAGTIGFVTLPIGFISLSRMDGDFTEFFIISLVMNTFGILTSALIFCRVIIDRFDKARGTALSLMMCASPLTGMVMPLLIGEIVNDHGWRTGYLALAAISAVGGAASLLMIGPSRKPQADPAGDALPEKTGARMMAIARNPIFLLLLCGMFLVNMPRTFATSQLKIAVLEYGFPDRVGTMIVSLYAFGTVMGRFLSGLALDRLPAHVVAMVALSFPAVGYLYFAYPQDMTWLLILAVFTIGIAFGSEFDVGAMILSRNFPARDFSKLYSLLDIALGLGSSMGSVILSATLTETSGYRTFMFIALVGTLIGAALVTATGRHRPLGKTAEPA
ncbi:Sugar phosphate permease [Novosphingobium sp. CF614]|uniref:MFS transporter n=1 Tax=Novosphingobium sp. CF614 TaxID=1884364 RepID=UPI0008E642EC|nr:MFS transporter [Novosphingobium sp. CF614]SFF77680.1 Sugar phosphate permease [Novosphingobium sp. CF614]